MVGGDGASEGGTVFRGCVKNPMPNYHGFLVISFSITWFTTEYRQC